MGRGRQAGGKPREPRKVWGSQGSADTGLGPLAPRTTGQYMYCLELPRRWYWLWQLQETNTQPCQRPFISWELPSPSFLHLPLSFTIHPPPPHLPRSADPEPHGGFPGWKGHWALGCWQTGTGQRRHRLRVLPRLPAGGLPGCRSPSRAPRATAAAPPAAGRTTRDSARSPPLPPQQRTARPGASERGAQPAWATPAQAVGRWQLLRRPLPSSRR